MEHIALLTGMILLFHIAWYFFSLKITSTPLPDENKIAQFADKNEKLLQLQKVSHLLETNYIDANDHRLHIDILGQGKGKPTLVFIPGTSVYAQIYMKFMHAVYQNGFNVIGFDPRGHGRSTGRRGDYSIDEIVDDALAIVAYARKRFESKVALAGSSQGGIAAFYAAARDDRLDAVVCHNFADLNGKDNLVLSQLKIPPQFTTLAQRIMTLYRRFVIPVSLYLHLSTYSFTEGVSVRQFIENDPLCGTWITIRAMNSLLKTPLAKPVEKITVPLLVVHSDLDHIFPQTYIENLFQRLTCRKEFLLFKGTSHFVVTQNAAEVAIKATSWLKGLWN